MDVGSAIEETEGLPWGQCWFLHHDAAGQVADFLAQRTCADDEQAPGGWIQSSTSDGHAMGPSWQMVVPHERPDAEATEDEPGRILTEDRATLLDEGQGDGGGTGVSEVGEGGRNL